MARLLPRRLPDYLPKTYSHFFDVRKTDFSPSHFNLFFFFGGRRFDGYSQ
jgi:hypothetical protein